MLLSPNYSDCMFSTENKFQFNNISVLCISQKTYFAVFLETGLVVVKGCEGHPVECRPQGCDITKIATLHFNAHAFT